MLHISLLKSVQVFFGAVRWTRASLSSSFLFLSSFEKRIKSDFFFFSSWGSPHLFVSLTVFDYCLRCCSTPSSLCLSRSISSACFTSTYLSSCLSPSLCLVGSSFFSAFYFPCVFVSHLPGGSSILLFFSFQTGRAVLWCSDIAGSTSQAVVGWLVGLSTVIHLCLNWPLETARVTGGKTTQDTEDRKGIKVGSHPAYPNCWWGCYKLRVTPHFLWSQPSITLLNCVNIGGRKYRLQKQWQCWFQKWNNEEGRRQ